MIEGSEGFNPYFYDPFNEFGGIERETKTNDFEFCEQMVMDGFGSGEQLTLIDAIRANANSSEGLEF